VTMLGIVISCDRTLQLDGLLQTFILPGSDFSTVHLNTVYRDFNQLHASQYQQLREKYTDYEDLCFVEATQFRRNVLWLLVSATARWPLESFSSSWAGFCLAAMARRQQPSGCGLLLVDDSLFIRGFSCSDVVHALARQPLALGVSLRWAPTPITAMHSINRKSRCAFNRSGPGWRTATGLPPKATSILRWRCQARSIAGAKSYRL